MDKVFSNQLYATNNVQSLQLPTITWNFGDYNISGGVSLQIYTSNMPVDEINTFADMSTDSESVENGGSVINSDNNYAMPITGNFRYIAFKLRYTGVANFNNTDADFENKILNASDGDLVVFNNDYEVPENLKDKFDYFTSSNGITHISAATYLCFKNNKWCDLVELYQSTPSALRKVVKSIGDI